MPRGAIGEFCRRCSSFHTVKGRVALCDAGPTTSCPHGAHPPMPLTSSLQRFVCRLDAPEALRRRKRGGPAGSPMELDRVMVPYQHRCAFGHALPLSCWIPLIPTRALLMPSVAESHRKAAMAPDANHGSSSIQHQLCHRAEPTARYTLRQALHRSLRSATPRLPSLRRLWALVGV